MSSRRCASHAPLTSHLHLGLPLRGSAVIILSQSLKIAAGLGDTPQAFVEWGAHLGACCFFIGSVMFLPQINTSEIVENEAAWVSR